MATAMDTLPRAIRMDMRCRTRMVIRRAIRCGVQARPMRHRASRRFSDPSPDRGEGRKSKREERNSRNKNKVWRGVMKVTPRFLFDTHTQATGEAFPFF
jgi:hypothetical protein